MRLSKNVPGLARTLARRSWKLLVAVGVLAVFGGAAFGAHHFLTHSAHFAVRTLRFSSTKHVTSESLAARAGEVIGLNLFRADLGEIARDVLQEPWIQSAHARRELPSTLVVDVTEREAAGGVALGPIYLADAGGNVFKRATPEEAAGLPVVTGVDRDLYLADPDGAKLQIRDALLAIRAWGGSRPALGEVHCDRVLGVTLYTVENSVGIRLGRPDGDVEARLKRFDAVWAAVQSEKPRLIYLDNRARPDRVTVKLAPPPPPPKKAKKTEVVPPRDDDSEERDS